MKNIWTRMENDSINLANKLLDARKRGIEIPRQSHCGYEGRQTKNKFKKSLQARC